MSIILSGEQLADFSNKNLQAIFKAYESELHFKQTQPHLNLMHLDVKYNHFTEKYNLLKSLEQKEIEKLRIRLNHEIGMTLFQIYQYTRSQYPQTPELLAEWHSYFLNPNAQPEEVMLYEAFLLLQNIGKEANENEISLLFCLKMLALKEKMLRTVFRGIVENSKFGTKERKQKSIAGKESAWERAQKSISIVAHAQKMKDADASMTDKVFSETFSAQYKLSPSTIRNILSKSRKKILTKITRTPLPVN